MKKTFLLIAAMLMAFSFALAACGGSEQSSGKSGESGSSGGSGGSGSGNQDTLVFGRGSDSVYLDPARATDGESFKVTKNIFETLVNFNYKDQSTEVVNTGLAKDWKISPDGLKYTFHLRQGIKFQDGTPFNAKAVVFNFNRWKNVKKGDKVQFPYYPSMFGGYGDKSVIKNVKAVDKYTVEFTLKRPLAAFLKDLAMSPFAIASPTAVKKYGADFTKHPVGTGPFKLVQWKPNNTITIEKYDDYWKKGYPKLNRVVFKVIKSNRARLTALENGEIDLMTGLNPSDIKEVKGKQDLQVFYRPPLNVGYLGLTVTRKPFDSVKVRKAMNYAINKKAIVKAFYADQAKVAAGPLPATIPGHNPNLKPYPYNPKKAKKLLAEAGYPDGFKMELWAMPVPRPYMPNGKKIAEAMQADLAKVGIDAKIVQYDWSTYLEKASKGEADAFLLGWTGDNGTADNFLYTLLSTAAIGGNNYTQYSNKKLDQLLIKAQKETDKDKRIKLYKKAVKVIHDTAPWVPIVHSTPALAGDANLKNFKPNPTGSDRLSYVSFK
ncbi:MAG TPA: ABC transporter substrate-binding protein [Bacillales bacterium]|nr:ABC transporter substrate-binding protein [Bacillales bacterium]